MACTDLATWPFAPGGLRQDDVRWLARIRPRIRRSCRKTHGHRSARPRGLASGAPHGVHGPGNECRWRANAAPRAGPCAPRGCHTPGKSLDSNGIALATVLEPMAHQWLAVREDLERNCVHVTPLPDAATVSGYPHSKSPKVEVVCTETICAWRRWQARVSPPKMMIATIAKAKRRPFEATVLGGCSVTHGGCDLSLASLSRNAASRLQTSTH